MLSAVLGLFSLDVALDLGSSRTRIYLRGKGPAVDQPAVVAVKTCKRGKRSVLAVGDDAERMVGRTPPDIAAVRPVRGGTIQDYEVAEALMVHLLRRLHGRNGWMSPKMVVTVPCVAGEMERRAVRECCESAGAREVYLVPKALAAALGAGLPVQEPSGLMVVDVGGGGTEVSVLSLSGVAHAQVVPGGGDGMDRALIEHLRHEFGVLIGERTARALKESLGSALGGDEDETSIVRGRDLVTGVPRAQQVSASDVTAALRLPVDAIAAGIRAALESTPPELASDVVDHGVVLVGGGANLRGLDRALAIRTGLPVVVADAPERACVEGAGRVLEELDLLQAMAS
jgi:rod shape-determining protein MreB and related proteins